jgi:WD40 repeat protein
VLRAYAGLITGAVFSPDGTKALSAGTDGTVWMWPTERRGEPLELRGHNAIVRRAVFSPDGSHIATASTDTTARIWPADGRGTPVVLRGHTGWVVSVAFSPDGSRLVTASADGTARVWSADGKGESPVIRGESLVIRGHPEEIYAATFSADGRTILTSARDGSVHLWSAGAQQAPVLFGNFRLLAGAAFVRGRVRVVANGADYTGYLWPPDGRGEPLPLRGHKGWIDSLAFSPDGTRIVTAADRDDVARIFPVDGSEPSMLRGHTEDVTAVAFSRDGTSIVTGSNDRTARLWSANASGEPVVLRGHTDIVTDAGFSPDRSRIVTASADGTARVWTVGLAPLLAWLRASTTSCLTPDVRVSALGESEGDAHGKFDACEQSTGADARIAGCPPHSRGCSHFLLLCERRRSFLALMVRRGNTVWKPRDATEAYRDRGRAI